jgi:membrane protease YdiL (CAAX protease family)
MFNEMGFLIEPSMIGYYAMGLIGSSLFEEPGWRGFTLPNLQRKYGNILGSIIVGSYWWIWHLPLWVVYGFEISLFDYLIFLSFSFLIDSLFNMAKRKIFVAMLLHSSLATAELYFIGFTNDILCVIILWSVMLIFRIIEMKKKEIITHKKIKTEY